MEQFDKGRYTKGTALLAALGILAIFSALGTAYVRFMALENAKSRLVVEEVYARQLAERGIWAAVGDAIEDVKTGRTPETGRFEALQFPIYGGLEGEELVPHNRYDGRVTLTVSDECAKLNLNHVPTRVLQAFLNVDGNTARAIKSSLPRPGESAGEERRWFSSLDDLGAWPTAYKGLRGGRADLATVYSVSHPDDPAGFINVNTASPQVLAAVLNPQAAEGVVKARESQAMQSLADLVAAAQATPDAFNLAPPEDAPDSLPREICFQSRGFRIVSESELIRIGSAGKPIAGKRIEAVVVFEKDGKPTFTYWSETSITEQ